MRNNIRGIKSRYLKWCYHCGEDFDKRVSLLEVCVHCIKETRKLEGFISDIHILRRIINDHEHLISHNIELKKKHNKITDRDDYTDITYRIDELRDEEAKLHKELEKYKKYLSSIWRVDYWKRGV